MAVEIGQLTINASVKDSDKPDEENKDTKDDDGSEKQILSDPCTDINEVKSDILAECRRMIQASLETVRER